MLQAFRFRRSPLYSDEGPPIGEVAVEEWAKVAFEIAAWVLRWGLSLHRLPGGLAGRT
jgi:hypothetical protein